MKNSRLKKEITKEIDRIGNELKLLSKDIFSHPELAFNEFYAQKKLCGFLEDKGVKTIKNIGKIKTAFKASLKRKKNCSSVALIAEYDALPQLGHACGHNIIGAASVGALAALNKFSESLNGNVSVVGTPGEEGGGGKVLLIKEKVFKEFDAAMMIHPSSLNKVVRRMLAMTELSFQFKGEAAHASAYPDRGVNALDAIILTFNNINALRQQLKDDARVHGIITDGGIAPNIIPEKASALFYVRAKELDYFHDLVKRVKKCASGAATATGTKLKISSPKFFYKPIKPNYALASLFSKNLMLLGITEDVVSETEEMGSSDIGNLSHELPTIHADISICSKDVACHTEGFAKAAISTRGMEGLINGAKALALTVVDILA